MRSLDDLLALYRERRTHSSALHGRWRELASVYDGGLVTPLPQYDEVSESAIPGLVSQGIDSYARRFASVQPAIDCPPLRPNIAQSRRKASERSKVIRGWWQGSHMGLADYQRGRFFFGYGAMPAILRPSVDRHGIPVWEALNPMSVLPGPKALGYSPELPDAFVAVTRTVEWLRSTYGIDFGSQPRPDAQVEVVEYIDAEQVTVFCLGPRISRTPGWVNGAMPTGFNYGSWAGIPKARQVKGGEWCVPISSYPNYAGMCTVTYPGAISLSKVSGLVDGILGMHKLQARLMALTVKAITKGIFPDTWVVTDPSSGGQGIIKEADGQRDIIGHVEGGQVVLNQIQPGYQTWNLLDRLESNQRSTAGIVPQMGGENPTNVRTGRASDTVAGFAVNPIIAEAHEVMQAAREAENRIAVAIAKGYGGGRSQSIYVAGRSSKKARIEYVPDDLFESDETVVRYSMVGADAQGLIIAAGQSIGTEMMSKHRARVLNPFVEDPEDEAIAIRAEAAEGALLGVLTEVAAGSPADAAYVLRRIKQGDPLEDIIEDAQRRAQERQASAGPVGAPDGPVDPNSPEAQAGLGDPAAAAAPPTVEAPPISARNLAQLMATSRRPAMTVPAERAG